MATRLSGVRAVTPDLLVKTMLTGISLHIPVVAGKLALGTWQGLYLVEHRTSAHRREVVLQFIGSRRKP
jgi:thiamine phosphate synthase YjbQ (UPF0047 family)